MAIISMPFSSFTLRYIFLKTADYTGYEKHQPVKTWEAADSFPWIVRIIGNILIRLAKEIIQFIKYIPGPGNLFDNLFVICHVIFFHLKSFSELCSRAFWLKTWPSHRYL